MNRVFDTQPRDGANPNSVWLPRKKDEAHFDDLLYQDGVHICVDGPSGTGKTSLVKTRLSKEKKRVIAIQLTGHERWLDICREIPAFSKHRQRRITTRDFCRAIEEANSVLFLDDFEKVNDDIVARVSDACKLMTQSVRGKIVIAGTQNIYHRLMSKEPALESRLLAISIGALPNIDEAWDFLCLGFDALGIMHPRRTTKSASGSFNQLRNCQIRIHDAADSLPKALNEFGRRVCITKAAASRRLSIDDLEDAAEKMFREKIDEYIGQFPRLRRLIEKMEIRAILGGLYRRKIGSILNVEDIFYETGGKLTREQFNDGLEQLVKSNIITRTGKNEETIFISSLYFAHIFGVCANKYVEYNLDPILYGPLGQLWLPLGDQPQPRELRRG